VDELVFIVGPLVIAVIAVRLDPGVGLLLFAAAALLGATWLSRQHATEPPPHAGAHVSRGSALRFPAVRVVATAFLAVGGIFGSVEVNTVAFTEERQAPGSVGLVLGAFALGSLLSGLAYGAHTWRSRSAGGSCCPCSRWPREPCRSPWSARSRC
jgi:hypothetical protein